MEVSRAGTVVLRSKMTERYGVAREPARPMHEQLTCDVRCNEGRGNTSMAAAVGEPPSRAREERERFLKARMIGVRRLRGVFRETGRAA